jgi:hypothetical protein
MNRKIILIGFSIVAFLAGLYFYLTFHETRRCAKSIEGLSGRRNVSPGTSCPDMLVRRGKTLLLYNSNLPAKAGENPLPFFNLNEYINYLEIQKKKGPICPVLFLQYENDAQGNDIYRIRPSPFAMQGPIQVQGTVGSKGTLDTVQKIDPATFVSNFDPTKVHTIDGKPIKIIDGNRDNAPFNQNMYAGFDPMGLHNGEYTELDAIHDATSYGKQISENPMDSNWGGVQTTEQSVNAGNYIDRYVAKPLYFTPKTNYIAGMGPLPPSEAPDYLKPRYE